MKHKKRKSIPDEDVADYWERHDASTLMDGPKNTRVELIFEPPVKSISLRLPLPLLLHIKRIAAGMDIAYQALIKVWLTEKAREKMQSG